MLNLQKYRGKMLAALVPALLVCTAVSADAEKLVILHTNDTHSQIDPTDKGMGGIQRRKVVIDSIRAANPNVLLIDAGDAVQGTLFFTLYGGEVEMKMMNLLGYDYAILGNHDFDNGVAGAAKNVAMSTAQWLTTNYDLRQCPQLDPLFKPYAIKEIGGKRIGIIGLNLDPKGMISEGNYDGIRYEDAIKAANATAWHLKHNERVDVVVAVTHLGYNSVSPSDRELAAASENINVILGGHTHTQIKPGSGDEWVTNAIGVPVLVTQNGKSGQWLTEVEIDLDATTDASNADSMPLYRQIAIDSRLDDRIDSSIDSLLQPYRAGVDEMMHLKIGRTARELNNDEPSLLNFIADFTLDMGKSLAPDGKVDIAITNKGSLRRSLPAGNITQGEIIMMQPFDNRIVVEDLSGADLAAALDVMAGRNGDGVSQGVDVVYDAATKKCTSITINGEPLDANRTYRVATIDYLANGGDYMAPLTKGTVLAKSTRIVYADLIDYIKTKFKGKKINPSNTARMRAAK